MLWVDTAALRISNAHSLAATASSDLHVIGLPKKAQLYKAREKVRMRVV